MRRATQLPLMSILVLCTAGSPAAAQGLTGLGPPGGLMAVDPKVPPFEDELLRLINERRANHKDKPSAIAVDPKLRAFSRNEAKLIAHGAPDAQQGAERVKKQGLAPFGHWYAFTFAADPKKALAAFEKDKATAGAFFEDFARAGIGAFYADGPEPFFQVVLLLVRDPDPMLGRPGLMPAQTDPVMAGALPKITACYDQALKQKPNLRGDVVMQVVIGGDGAVQSDKFLKGLLDPGFEGCVSGVLRALRFPKPYKGKPVTLTHPIRLRPPQGDRRLGTLTPSEIQSAFGMARADIKRCYDDRSAERKKTDPNIAPLSGKITLAIVVAPDGSQKSFEILHDDILDGPLQTCVISRAKQIRFPRPKGDGEVDINYPLEFSPPPPQP